MSQNTVPFDRKHVQAYLDRCIQFWREQDRDGNVVALDYIDAFQSVRMSLFGELLPQEESSKTRAVELRNEAVTSIRDGDSTVSENFTSENAGYVPYGEAWQKEMMKFKKSEIVEFLRQAYEKAESKSARHS